MTLIVTNDLSTGAGTLISASDEEASFPASNLKVLQPSRRWRTTTVSGTPYISAVLDDGGAVAASYDTVALIGYRGATSRNRLGSALDFDSVRWTQTNTVPAPATVDSPSGLTVAPIAIVATATAATNVTQSTHAPGTGSDLGAAALSYRTEVLARQNGSDDLDLRIHVGGADLAVDFTWRNFDLSAGTLGATSTGTDFTLTDSTITALGGGWYRCAIEYTTGTEDTLQVRLSLLTAAAGTSITLGDGLILAAPITMLQTTPETLAEYPVTAHAGSGPMFQVRVGWDLPTTETTAARSGWKHAAQRNALRGFDLLDFYHRFAAPRSEYDIWLELADANNANGYIEAVRLVVGTATDLSSNLAGMALGAEESGGQQEAAGGQIFRPQRRIRRRIELDFDCLDRQKALDDIYLLQRTQGRSRQVLVIAEPDETTYGQEFMIYGYIEQLDPIPRRNVDRWSWRVSVVETP